MFTIEQLKREIINLIESNPDTIYKEANCKYTRGECSNGSVGCLIGQALVNVDPTVKEFLEETDKLEHDDDITVVLQKLAEENIVNIKNNDLMWIDMVQYYNDSGMPWEEIRRRVFC